jgi:hypothetical protein
MAGAHLSLLKALPGCLILGTSMVMALHGKPQLLPPHSTDENEESPMTPEAVYKSPFLH